MAHFHTTESYLKKVCRIAKELDIGIEEAAMTCDAFELAFSDLETRRAIFGMIDQLDESAARKGEPLGLIITYAVEVGRDGIHVGRYADYIPPGQTIELTPANQAMIFLRITDDFPTQEVLGPMIVNRPELEFDSETNKLPSLDRSTGQSYGQNEGWQPDVFCRADGVVCSDTHTTRSELPTELPSHWPDVPICLGPVRLKFEERFPFLFAAASNAKRGRRMFSFDSSSCMAITPHPLPPLAALQVGTPAFQSASGLSPPPVIGECGHSASKDVPRHWQ